MLINKNIKGLALLTCSILLISCGGGSDESSNTEEAAPAPVPVTPAPTTPTPPAKTSVFVTGTAATGAPIVGDIELVDAQNTSSGQIPINSDGSFSIEVTDYTAPFLLRTTDLNGNNLHALATEAGVTNVTELTELALFLAEEIDPTELYNDWVQYVDGIDLEELQNKLTEASEEIFENFGSIFSLNKLDVNDIDIFRTPFLADGTGLDGVLDVLEIDFNYTAASVAEALQISVAGSPYNWVIDASDIDFNNDGTTGDITGDWRLTIIVNGLTVLTINDMPAPDANDLDTIRDVVLEQANDDSISNISITVVADTPTRKEFDITFDVSVSANGISFDQTFSYKYVYELI